MNEALRQCEISGVNFKDVFRFQYVIAPERLGLPDMHVEPVGNHFVHIGSALNKKIVLDSNGRSIGIFLGVASDHDGNDPVEILPEFIHSEDPQAFEIFENYLTNISGRFAFILNLKGQTRFYADAVAMIGAVYAPETKRLASSPLLTIDREIIPNPLYDHSLVENGTHSYGLEHTADAHIFRLNANHYMDLETLEHKRFWPLPTDSFEAKFDDYGDIYDEMIQATRHIMTSLASRFTTSLPLSGGLDSRILFALAGEEGRSKISQYFTHITNYASRRDSAVASMIVDRAGLTHEVHDKKRYKKNLEFIEAHSLAWPIGSGTNSPPPSEITTSMLRHVKQNSVVMRGHQTNIMRGQYFNFRKPKLSETPAWQLNMMKLASIDQSNGGASRVFGKSIQAFHDELPANAQKRIADFIFYEALVPAALGVLFQGVNHVFFISPFNSRRLVQLAMQFETDYKLSNFASHDIVLRAMPELLGIPLVNDLTASFEDTEEGLEQRQDRITQARIRHKKLFGIEAPEVTCQEMDLDPYHEIIGNIRKKRKKASAES